jgi:choline dehydrogenase
MTGLAIPGAAFIRVDDERYIPVDSQMELVLREDVTPRLPYDSKSSSGVPVRVNNAGKNTPDLEIMWFPLILGNFGVKTPPGIYGATAVSTTFAAFFI